MSAHVRKQANTMTMTMTMSTRRNRPASSPTTAALLAAAVATSATIASFAPGGVADAFSPSPLLPSPSAAAFRRDVIRPSGRDAGAPSRLYSTLPPGIQNQPTELPDSLADAAAIAANACHQLHLTSGTAVRCRVDFDTSIGDETYTTLKSSSEFMQLFLNSLCLASIEGTMEWKQGCAMRLIEARTELGDVREKLEGMGMNGEDDDVDFGEYPGGDESVDEAKSDVAPNEEADKLAEREAELLQIIANEGTDPSFEWTGPAVRIYFPDEGSAALARRDWASRVPPCVRFASCGGVQVADTSRDAIVMFFCPRASEAENVEEILYSAEERLGENLRMTVMVNPLLVDMGVTGFGMAGRRLRERLIDGLVPAYYLRTLPWGALTRVWPRLFTVWQEDEGAEGGYRMIRAMDRLPSNPEVEDIYDIENGNMDAPREGTGLLNALGDFVNGMTRL